jgi:hypothetical protein
VAANDDRVRGLPGALRRLCRRRPLLVLILLGVASEAVYLSYVFFYPLVAYARADRPYDLEKLSRTRHWAAIIYVVGLVALFAAFWAALRIVQRLHEVDARRMRIILRLVLAFGLVFGLTLAWLYPVTADDLFRYVLRARLRVVHGANPFVATPDLFPDDLAFFPSEWADHTSPYGPVWELLAGAIVRLGFGGPLSGTLVYKGVALLAYAACAGLLAWGTRGDPRALVLFAWNPLVLLQGPGNGHNDLLMMAWALLALLLWERKRWWVPAVAAMSLAVLTKLPAVLLAPLLMVAILRAQDGWLRRLGILVAAGVLAAGLVVLAYLPFWPVWESLTGVLEELSGSYTYTIAALLRMALREFIPNRLAYAIPRTAGRVLFGLLYLWTLVRLWRRRASLAESGCFIYFAYLLTSAGYRIWYPLWLVPLAVLHFTPRTRLRTYLLCLTSELSILMFYLVWRWLLNGVVLPKASWLMMHVITVPWQFGLPLLLPLRRRATFGREEAIGAGGRVPAPESLLDSRA